MARLNNITIIGETDAKDCNSRTECDSEPHDGCINKVGLILPYFSEFGKEIMPNSSL